MRSIEDRDRIKKMLLRRPESLQEPLRHPSEYLDELRDDLTAEALTEASVKHERSKELWDSE